MALFEPHEWSFTEKAMGLVTTNPFHPSWREEEAEILALPLRDVPTGIAWRPGAQLWGQRSPFTPKSSTGESVSWWSACAGSWKAGRPPATRNWTGTNSCRCTGSTANMGDEMDRWIDSAVRGDGKGSGIGRPPEEDERPPDVKTLWADFHSEYETLLRFKNRDFAPKYKPEHLFACFFLFRRAFYHIFFNIIGTSKPIAELRSRVWESIVTRDLLGWMQGLHERMKDFPTLITGPSGTGKERAAEAIGRSLYIPFTSRRRSRPTSSRRSTRSTCPRCRPC